MTKRCAGFGPPPEYGPPSGLGDYLQGMPGLKEARAAVARGSVTEGEVGKPVTAMEILDAAVGHIDDRSKTYDSPDGERSVAAVVTAFNVLTGQALTETEGWLFLALLKIRRGHIAPGFHQDSWTDLAAYAGLAGEARSRSAAE